MMAQYDEGLEAVPPSCPEVVEHRTFLPYSYQRQTLVKHDQSPCSGYTSTSPSICNGSHHSFAPHGQPRQPVRAGKRPARRICGLTTIVFTLLTVIAVLVTVVIGLLAGVAVEANRANRALAQQSAQSATLAASPSSFAALDNNCSGDPGSVTGQPYTSFKRKQPRRALQACQSRS